MLSKKRATTSLGGITFAVAVGAALFCVGSTTFASPTEAFDSVGEGLVPESGELLPPQPVAQRVPNNIATVKSLRIVITSL
jgi:hypothetical protein